MNLLILTNEGDERPDGFEEHVDSVTEHKIKDLSPEVIDGKTDVRIKDISATDFDAAFLRIRPKNAVFGRVLLEMLEEHHVRVNYPSTAFFTMAKKNYLYYVLHQKDVQAPKTGIVASEEAARNLERELSGPLLARRFDDLVENERKIIKEVSDIEAFVSGPDYDETFIAFQEYISGDMYRSLRVGDEIISLEDDHDNIWPDTDNLNYSNLPEDQQHEVMKAAKAIGAPVAEVILIDGNVVDVNPNPDLDMYTDISGKDVYRRVTEVLREDDTL